jgi:hypothetical protein
VWLVNKFPHILWNPKFRYWVHYSPTLVPVLSQMNPVHTLTTYYLKNNVNITLTSTSRSCKYFEYQILTCISKLPHECCMSRSLHTHSHGRMEAKRRSETSVDFHGTRRLYNPLHNFSFSMPSSDLQPISQLRFETAPPKHSAGVFGAVRDRRSICYWCSPTYDLGYSKRNP